MIDTTPGFSLKEIKRLLLLTHGKPEKIFLMSPYRY